MFTFGYKHKKAIISPPLVLPFGLLCLSIVQSSARGTQRPSKWIPPWLGPAAVMCPFLAVFVGRSSNALFYLFPQTKRFRSAVPSLFISDNRPCTVEHCDVLLLYAQHQHNVLFQYGLFDTVGNLSKRNHRNFQRLGSPFRTSQYDSDVCQNRTVHFFKYETYCICTKSGVITNCLEGNISIPKLYTAHVN